MPTHSIQTRYFTEEGIVADFTDAVSGDALGLGALAWDGVIPISTNQEIDLAFAYANLKALCLYASKAATIYTNANDGAGGDTIVLAAGQVFAWSVHSGVPNPLAYNVAKMFAKNLSGTLTPSVKIRVLVDVTP